MKKQQFCRLPKIFLFLLALIIVFPSKGDLNAQNQQFNVVVTISPQIPNLDWGSFLYINGISGLPTIFRVQTTPEDPQIDTYYIVLTLYWDPDGNGQYQELLRLQLDQSAMVPPYSNFTNNQIGVSPLTSQSFIINDELGTRARRIGTLAGNYRLVGQVMNDEQSPGGPIGEGSAEFFVSNPTNNLIIQAPSPGSQQDPNNVIAIWNLLQGVTTYRVIANAGTNLPSDDEDALNQGTPYIFQDVPNTGINLVTLLSRAWSPGDEVILRVIGNPGPNEIKSNFVRFWLIDTDQQAANIEQLIESLTTLLLATGLEGEEVEEFLEGLQDGTIQIDGITGPNGMPLSPEQIRRLFEYILNNPDMVISFDKQ